MLSKHDTESIPSLLFGLRAITVAYWIFLTMLLWLPDPRALLWGWEPAEGPRGYAHIITFALLGLLVELGRRKKSLLFWVTVLAGYTFLTEIVQEMLPIRAFEWGDILQDLVGAFFGLGVGYALRNFDRTSEVQWLGWCLCLAMFLYWASLPPLGVWPLAFVAPMLWSVLVRYPQPLNFRYVYAAAFVFWLASIWWIACPHPLTASGLIAMAAVLPMY